MIDVISSTMSDQNTAYISCMFLENLALKRTADVQQYDDKIIDVMKVDGISSGTACFLLAKLATDKARIAFYTAFRCLISAKEGSSVYSSVGLHFHRLGIQYNTIKEFITRAMSVSWQNRRRFHTLNSWIKN